MQPYQKYQVTFLSPIKKERVTWTVSHKGLMFMANKALTDQYITVNTIRPSERFYDAWQDDKRRW